MKAYAQDAERLASEQGISLDYTEESLERVDLLHKIAGDTVLALRTPEEKVSSGRCPRFTADISARS